MVSKMMTVRAVAAFTLGVVLAFGVDNAFAMDLSPQPYTANPVLSMVDMLGWEQQTNNEFAHAPVLKPGSRL